MLYWYSVNEIRNVYLKNIHGHVPDEVRENEYCKFVTEMGFQRGPGAWLGSGARGDFQGKYGAWPCELVHAPWLMGMGVHAVDERGGDMGSPVAYLGAIIKPWLP